MRPRGCAEIPSVIAIPVFILIALGILFAGHYFVYASFVYFFAITAPWEQAVLAATFFFLVLSFIVAMFVAHRYEGRSVRAFYFGSTLWLGVGLTLLTTFSFAWTAWGAAASLARNPSRFEVGSITVTAALLYSAYGVANAYYPRVVRHSIRLKHLPPSWRGRTLVQLSDIHLGQVIGTRFLARVVERVNALRPAAVLITGDLFDGNDGNLEALVAPLQGLTAEQGVYFVTGNHETYLGVERAFAALSGTGVRILDNECVNVEGLQLVGISYLRRGSAGSFTETLASVSGFDSSQPSVLLYHSPSQIAEAKAAGIGLQLSGHVHQAQLFPLQFITRLIFGKYHHGLNVEEDFTVYTTSGTGLWGPTMRTGNHPEIVAITLS